MLLLVHYLSWISQVDSFDHHASDRAFLDGEQLEQVSLVDLCDEFADFDIAVEVLPAPPTRQVNKGVAVVAAFLAQAVLNLQNVSLFEKPHGSILQLAHV